MSSSANTELNIWVKLKDDASKSLKGLDKSLKDLEPTFKRMTLIGTATFAGLASAVGLAVAESAKAEGSYAKFNTVFGELSGDMMDFINDIRSEMPTATHEIVRMSADLQDLLIPLGLTREAGADLTKGFVDLANKLGAFNDVDPTEVLEAFKSGLTGSSEPLKRFGINASIASLEARALKEGLLDAGQTLNDLDEEARNQVVAQALLAQSVANSSDAINGFAENNDSLIRRSQNLKATITEIKVAFGDIFLPMIDEATKKILPLVSNLREWVKANEDLAKTITLVTAGISATMVALGTIGLILPKVIEGFRLLTSGYKNLAKMEVLLPIISAIAGVFPKLTNSLLTMAVFMSGPWGTAIKVAIGLLTAIFVTSEQARGKVGGLLDGFLEFAGGLASGVLPALQSAGEFIMTMAQGLGDLFNTISESEAFSFTMGVISEALTSIGEVVQYNLMPALRELWTAISTNLAPLFGALGELLRATAPAWQALGKVLGAVLVVAVNAFVGALTVLIITITQVITWLTQLTTFIVNLLGPAIEKASGWISGFADTFKTVWEWINKAIDALGEFLSMAGEKISGSFKLPSFFRAEGGPVSAGNPYIVGEKGPEVFVPGSSGSILASGGGASYNVTIQGNTFIGERDLTEKVGQELITLYQRSNLVG